MWLIGFLHQQEFLNKKREEINMSENNEMINGMIKISDEVVETIASVAISEISGVSSTGSGFVDGIAKRLTKKPVTSGI